MYTASLYFVILELKVANKIHRGPHAKIFGWAKSAAHDPRSAKYDAIDYLVFDTSKISRPKYEISKN